MNLADGKLERLNAFINSSAVVAEIAGADIAEPAYKAAMYDENGNVAVATDGAKAFGLILGNTPGPIAKGRQVDVLIKDIGLLEAGGGIAKGDPVTVNASGQGTKAAKGDFIFGWAFTGAASGECAQVQISRSGHMG